MLHPRTTRVNNSVVEINNRGWWYGLTVTESISNVEQNAGWLRSQRAQLGWTTEDLAEHARRTARDFGDPIKLPQQLVSKFENGKIKSTPKWVGYAQIAIADFCSGKRPLTEDFHSLRLPKDMSSYFHAISLERQRREFDDMDEFDCSITDEEQKLIEEFRMLEFEEQFSVSHIIKSLAKKSAPQTTLHNDRRAYQAEV